MDKLNELGFINFWGASPSHNFVYGEEFNLEEIFKTKRVLNIFTSNNLDCRNILKTINGLNDLKKQIDKVDVNFYIYETNLESLVRNLVFIDLIASEDYSNQEKIDMFLELYGNTFLTEKTSGYLSASIPRLTNVIYCKKSSSNYQQYFDFSHLGYKDVDSMKEIIDSYHEKVEFDIEKLRDERLRYLYKDRYNYRENLVDWDYQMKTRKFVDYIGYNIYKRFRMSGISFEKYMSKYNKPNKTLSSYIPGRSKKTKDSIMVRGFWGDIVNSPYLAFGIELDDKEEEEHFKRKMQHEFMFNSEIISEYNITKLLYGRNDDYFKKKKKSEQKEQSAETQIMIVDKKLQTEIKENILIRVSEKINLKFIFLSGPLDKLLEKKRYQKLFDFFSIGFNNNAGIFKLCKNSLFNENSKVWVEIPL